MSRQCDHCGRGSQRGASRSHSNIRTLKRQYINLQKVGGKKICTRCLRTMTKKSDVSALATA